MLSDRKSQTIKTFFKRLLLQENILFAEVCTVYTWRVNIAV